MDEQQQQHKALLCLTATCLPRTQWAADFLRSLGTALKIPEASIDGAVTLTYISGNENEGSIEEEESMLERAEQMALSFRSTVILTKENAIQGFVTAFLLVLRGREFLEAAGSASSGQESNKSGRSAKEVLKYDARTSIVLRRLALLLRIKLSALAALEEHAIREMQMDMLRIQKQTAAVSATSEGEEASASSGKRSWVRNAKIGAAATAAGGLLFVTGGLAAPALAAGLVGLGLVGVAGLATTTTVAALLGGAGAGLGAYKMSRRTKGLTQFEFQKINGEQVGRNEEEMKGMTVYICVSGLLRQSGPAEDGNTTSDASTSPDFYCPWGAQPPRMTTAQMLVRYYSVVAPDRLPIVPLLLKSCSAREDELMNKLSNLYHLHPKNLTPDSSRPSYFLQGNEGDVYREVLSYGVAHVKNVLCVKADKQAIEFPKEALALISDEEKPWDGTFQSLEEEMPAQAGEVDMVQSEKEMATLVAEMDQKLKAEPKRDMVDQKLLNSLVEELERLGMEDVLPSAQPTPEGSYFGHTGLDNFLFSAASPRDEVYWWRESIARYGDQYTLLWDPEKLLEIGQCVKKLVREGIEKGVKKTLQYTALSAVLSAVALPLTVVSLVSGLDESWTMAVEAADEAGVLLADALMSEAHGNRPVVLIGYSIGGCVVAKCLSELAAIAYGNSKNFSEAETTYLNVDYDFLTQSIENDDSLSDLERKRRLRAATVIRDAVIIGAPCDTNAFKWEQRRSVVLGRLINVFSSKDWVLSLLYRYKRWSVIPLAGLREVNIQSAANDKKRPTHCSVVENFDASSIIDNHGDYPSKMKHILHMVGIGDVDCEQYNGKYFVAG